MSEADFQLVLSQFLLRDETSETPKIHPRKIEKSKTAIQNKLNLYIEELEKNEIEINLTDYKAALKQLKKMKASEYDEVVMEIVENYELLAQKKYRIFPSESTPYPDSVLNRQIEDLTKNEEMFTQENPETSSSEPSNGKNFLSDFRKRSAKIKNEK